MSGGRLVVLDRLGRDGKRFALPQGLATLGSDPACDIRIMLPAVCPHHATVVVHANQTVIRNVCAEATLVNGRGVSVAALRHRDVISIGGRRLRWEYADPAARRPQAPEPALQLPARPARGRRRGSGPAPARARDPQLQLRLELAHRASMPGSAGGKQVAIVQPQRRDTSDHIDKTPPRSPQQASKRPRTSKTDLDTSANESEQEKTKRKSATRVSSQATPSNLQTTKASLWIESRKSSPRKSKAQCTPEVVLRARRNTASAKKSTPLRLAVLKRAQSAHKMRVTKIEGPVKIDHTKQAAIRLMTGHSQSPRTPTFLVKKSSPVRRTPRARNTRSSPSTSATPGNTSARAGNTSGSAGSTSATPSNASSSAGNTSGRRSAGNRTVTILEITDSDGRDSSVRKSTASRRSGQKSPRKSSVSTSPRKSSAPTSPRKSALKDPSAKRGARKTESIKFDLSNLESHSHDTDVVMLGDSTRASLAGDSTCASLAGDSATDEDVTLRYSPSPSPSPRRPIHSRSSRILEKTLGSSVVASPPARTPPPRSPPSPRSHRTSRGSLIMQRALNDTDASSYSRRTTKSATDDSRNTTVATAFRTRTLSPRTSRNDLESYSIVDLVSVDTDDSALSTSVYGSAGSGASTAFGTPQTTGRRTRSTIDPTLLGSSTPYVKGRGSTPRCRSNPSPQNSSKASANGTQSTIRSSRSKRSKSLSTPENTEDAKKHISVNSTRISRASRSRSRLNDSELLLLDDDDDSPRTSKRISTASKSARFSAQTANDTELTPTHSHAVQENGTCTPENRHSPEEASTPVLSIQSLLDSSQSSFASQKSRRKGRPSFNTKRKTIGGVTGPKTKVGAKSKSLSFNARKTRLRLSSDSVEILNKDESEIVTPKSAVKLVPEGVKNKHSTAKKPQSKRSIIDDLNSSDIVKQLFSSPVKRKLSQSMTEFSRRLSDDTAPRTTRHKRNTIAVAGRTPDISLLDHTDSYTPELFVSPISTPTRSPSLDGIKLMFAKTTPENDLRNVRGVKRLLRTPRTRRSIKNDLTDVSGVKKIFAKSPKNRLSDVRVKEVFVSSPKNDLRRVTGVKSLFQVARTRKSPRNELDDVRGVKKLFQTKSPANDLRNVSGVKRTLRRQSPKNDLSDLRGVKRVFRREKRNDLSDVSGVEELFNLSNLSTGTVSTRAESLFDQLVGKPQIKAVYSKTFSSKTVSKTKGPRAKSLHASLDQVTASDNNWLEQELNKRLQIKNYLDSLQTANTSKANRSKQNKSKSLHASLNEVADVDVLLEQELNKEQQINNYLESMRSVNESKSKKSSPNRSRVNKSKASTSKANLSRELLKLATDTIEGEAPLLTSRVRTSTVLKSNETEAERKKSASELYSAHTLPIKKRSLVDTSGDKALLPLKKRAVLHSTPVKGRLHVTMNASALSRVSPIRADDDTRLADQDTSVTSTQPKQATEVKTKSKRGTRANTENKETSNAIEFVKPSPKKTRGRPKVASPKAKPASPRKEKVAKAKKASPVKDNDASPVKTRNASPAKAKKESPAKTKKASPAKSKKDSPVKTRKASTTKAKKASPVKAKEASPAKTKSTPARAKKAVPAKSKAVSPVKKASPEKLPSPAPVKATRSRRNNASTLEPNVKKRRASLVVAKKSPVMSPKPRATRKRKEPETTTTPVQSPKKTRATRKNTSVKDDKPKTPKSTRAKVQKATVVVAKPSPLLKPRATRRAQADQTEQQPKETTRKTRKTVTLQETQPESPKKSQAQRKSGKTQVEDVQPKTRGRKTAVSESKDVTVEKPEPKAKRGRKTDEPAAKKTKKQPQEKSTEESESKDISVDKPEPKAKRGRKTDESAAKKTKKETREKSMEEVKPVKTRGKKVETQESLESLPSTRGRRGAKANTIVPEVIAKTRKRKSDTAPENELPSKVRKSKEVAERGRKRTTEVSTEMKGTRNKSAVKDKVEKVSEAPVKVTRGRKTAEVEVKGTKQAEQKTRGRKANIENVPANQVTGKRKRTAEPSPVKLRNTRANRGTIEPEGKPAGRSRRR